MTRNPVEELKMTLDLPFMAWQNSGLIYSGADRNGSHISVWAKLCVSPDCYAVAQGTVTSQIHDRMPVILGRDDYDLWLDPGMTDVEAISSLLKPFDARLMRCYAVSTRINQAVNDDAECAKMVELEAPPQRQLF